MSSLTAISNLSSYCDEVAHRAKEASRQLVAVSTTSKNRWLLLAADQIQKRQSEILAANHRDLDRSNSLGLSDAQKDRLRLTSQRVDLIAQGLRDIASLPDPIGEEIESYSRPNGLQVRKVRVPLGVILFIYESRPNVTADAAAIAIKSSNAIILRGGKEAFESSKAIVQVLRETADEAGIPLDAIQLVETLDREAVGKFLQLSHLIDLVIPRGGESLIRRVVDEATMPVLKHYDGNCHVYVDASADLGQALLIIENAKCQRMGVCNAMESLIVHRAIAAQFLPQLVKHLAPYKLEYRADEESTRWIPNAAPATEKDWSTEYLGPIMSVRIVGSIDEAVKHINRYGSRHTDAIISQDRAAVDQFILGVDTAAVVVNASTRFHDGGELGMGAEIGISTDKFHARGPCGLRELTTYKYVVIGNGQIRS